MTFARFLVLIACLLATSASAAPKEKRARPPQWTADQRRIFFDDFRTALVGARPDFGQMAESIAKAASSAAGTEASSAGGFRWSEWITTDTLETEIKRQSQTAAKLTQTATAFKGGGYRDARDSFSVLALMFRLSADHDNDARWRDSAPGLSILFGRAAANCKVGTDGSFREAAARARDLTELVRGGRPDVPKKDDDQKWSDLADRSPIMKKMEVIQQKTLGPLTGSKNTFSRSAEDAAHEAQVLAVLAEIMTREEFPDAGDEDYDGFARTLRDAAADISRAADQGDYETARAAMGRVNQSCSDCHDNYRG